MRIEIPAVAIEFDEGGHTIWVQSPKGATILRIKCTGKIKVHTHAAKYENGVSHADVMVQGDIDVCLAKEDHDRAAALAGPDMDTGEGATK